MTKAREIAELGQKLTVDASGNLGFSGDIELGDNNKAVFGAGSDLQIYHDGDDSYVKDAGTGNLILQGTNVEILDGGGDRHALFAENNASTFYFNGLAKLATTSTGISVTGNATFADNGKAVFGAGSDLQIYHDGTHSYIEESGGTGNLQIRSDSIINIAKSPFEYMASFNADGPVQLYYDNSQKLATTSTGCLLYTSPSPRDGLLSRMPSSA